VQAATDQERGHGGHEAELLAPAVELLARGRVRLDVALEHA
jgi:hypothetical protein